MSYYISYWGISHIGNVRKMNQDNLVCGKKYKNIRKNSFSTYSIKSSKENLLLGIFDGMGGGECGEIASYIAAQNAVSFQTRANVISNIKTLCQKSDADISEYAKKNDIFSMGTTAAMLLFTKKSIVLCNIGDSKIFRFAQGKMEQISKDHVAIAACGVKPPLSQYLGASISNLVIDPYLAQGSYDKRDVYLICSDGLTDMVSLKEISDILSLNQPKDAIDLLLKRALENGGKDNISIIICKIEGLFDYLVNKIILGGKKESYEN